MLRLGLPIRNCGKCLCPAKRTGVCQAPLTSSMPPRIRLPFIPYTTGSNNNLVRDHMRRQAVQAFEVERTTFKAIVTDQTLPYSVRQQVQRMFETEVPRDSAAVRVRNRCALTGRGRGVNSFYRISRIMFRTLANEGLIPGVRRHIW
jgi:small subunit ribosomal protein S14